MRESVCERERVCACECESECERDRVLCERVSV